MKPEQIVLALLFVAWSGLMVLFGRVYDRPSSVVTLELEQCKELNKMQGDFIDSLEIKVRNLKDQVKDTVGLFGCQHTTRLRVAWDFSDSFPTMIIAL